MTTQEWDEWRRQVDHEETQLRTVRCGGRTWQVRTTWRGRGTRQVRIVRTEKRRLGWDQGVWREVRRGHLQDGVVLSEVWS